MKILLPASIRSCLCLAFAAALATSVRATVTNLAWYRLGENDPGAASGQVVKSATIDFVGVNHLRRFGSPHYTNEVSKPAAVQLGSSLAVLFSGSGQYYSNAVVTTARNNFGLEAWVQPGSVFLSGTYVIAHNGNTGANGWGIYWDGNNYSAVIGGAVTFGSVPAVSGRWAHVALVRDGGTSTLYVNGVASGSTTTTPGTPAGGFAIATRPQLPTAGFFPGAIDEVRVFTFAAGQFSTDDLLFNPHRVTTQPATGITPVSATLNGSANSLDFPTTVWFEWGISTNLGNLTPPQALGSGFTTTNFSQVLDALTAGFTYYFRAVATNDLGIALGGVQIFTIGPSVETLPASALGTTTATLNGSVNPLDLPVSAWFEWGLTTNYGNVTPPQALGSGASDPNFGEVLSGLIPGGRIHFRAVASNDLGVVSGSDQSFRTVGPRFVQQAYLKASNTEAFDLFGARFAISGDTVVIGARSEDSNATGVNGDGSNNTSTSSGAAYVFVFSGTSWIYQAYLKASNTGIGDSFGESMAVSGDTIVVGAPREDSDAIGVNGDGSNDNAFDSGAAYVFVRSGTTWTQQAYLKASNTGAGDFFGTSVSVSGDTIVVGADDESSDATGVNGDGSNDNASRSGAAYVFVRSGTNWTQQAYLKASNTGSNDLFGLPVAVSGDTIVVGARGEGSIATGINGDGGDNSLRNAGAAYVFARSGTNWSQQAYLKASNTDEDDAFGTSVAVSGETVVVGAPGERSDATGVNGDGSNNNAPDSGAAYVFVRSGTTWTQQAYLKASNTDIFDQFGSSVAVSDETVVVGAPTESSNATGINGDGSDNSVGESGAAYVFARGGATWSQQAYLKASNTGSGDFFGTYVAVSGDTVVVGADGESSNAIGVNGDGSNNTAVRSGAAYVFGPPLPPAPEIAVEQSNTNIFDGGSSQEYVMAVFNTLSRSFTIKNRGDGDLTGLTITIDGPDAAMFSVTTSPTAPVPPGSNTTFVVRFAPTSPGTKTAALHLANNVEGENPFDIILNGLSLSFTEDTDGDGLSDAAEIQMAALGFDWQVSQPDLVNALFSNASGAGLFTLPQVQALNVDTPLLAKDPLSGFFKLTIGVEKATQLTNFSPFPMTAPQTTINGQGNLEFQFSAPDNAAFFRLEAK